MAIYWKNGIATNITNGDRKARANSIIVLGSDIFEFGNEENIAFYTVDKY